METISFENLKREVIDNCLCISCGACVAVCPVGCIAFKGDGPELVEECIRCGLCLDRPAPDRRSTRRAGPAAFRTG